MTETNDKDGRKSLSLNKPLEAKKTAGGIGQVRQSFTHGRSKTVQVEVRRKRGAGTLSAPKAVAPGAAPAVMAPKKTLSVSKPGPAKATAAPERKSGGSKKLPILTTDEKTARAAALAGARAQIVQDSERKALEEVERAEEEKRLIAESAEAEKAEKAVAAEAEKVAKRRSPEERRLAEEEEARRLLDEADAAKNAQVAVHREKNKNAPKPEEPTRAARPAPTRNLRDTGTNDAQTVDSTGRKKQLSGS
ncbi:MAG: IF-2-associated domain-containing protein [Rhizobiales bacterium]|nr:IF-2-associated domain-containing protein [Hyphomicrobiales bacterium]